MYNEDKKFVLKVVLAAIIIIAVLCWGLVSLTIYSDNKTYNNGHCAQCYTGRYCYESSVGNENGATHIYKCDNCGHRIQVYVLR